LTNHAHVLLCLDGRPQPTLREVAGAVGITERAVQRIVAELEADGVLTRIRQGRRNAYRINPSSRLRHPLESHCTVKQVLSLVKRGGERS